jgi:hypothetical protein
MNEQLFLMITSALIVGNVVNKLIVNPLIYKLLSVLFGGSQRGSSKIVDSAKMKKQQVGVG